MDLDGGSAGLDDRRPIRGEYYRSRSRADREKMAGRVVGESGVAGVDIDKLRKV